MASEPKRRTISMVLFVLALVIIVLGLVFGAASDRLIFVLLGLALAVGGAIFYRRGR